MGRGHPADEERYPHYAKRQWTWFQADPEVCWRDPSLDRERIFDGVTSFLREEDKE